VRTLAEAAQVLDCVTDVATTQPLLEALGFGAAVPIIDASLEALAFTPAVLSPSVARGRGTLRAMVFELPADADLRAELTRVAVRLSKAAPQMLWILVAIQGSTVVVAAFDISLTRPRVAALIAKRGSIVDSDAETLCALSAADRSSEALTHCRWMEILGRESVSARFFKALEQIVRNMSHEVSGRVADGESFQLALLCASRLLFLSFLETKGWLDGDHGFLGNRFADCMLSGGDYHRRVLQPLFFGTLNTPPKNRAARARGFGRIPFLNGGLFSRSPLEGRYPRVFFTDEILGELFGDLLARYRFTAREDSAHFSQAAVDPEMLGKSFESLMSSMDRKSSGAFYTPQSLVAKVSERTLAYALSSENACNDTVARALAGEIVPAAPRASILESVSTTRVLDPACGSGSFLVYILEQLATLRLHLGDLRPLHVIRREVLTSSIFGVDINPTAVWLCELRLWLSMAIEDPQADPLRVTPLPNLDRNIRIGDSLSGEAFGDGLRFGTGRRVVVTRRRYSRATGQKKRALARGLDSIERQCAVDELTRKIDRVRAERAELLRLARARDLFGDRHVPPPATKTRLRELRQELIEARRELKRIRDGGALPFSFAAGFGDVASSGGFDMVIGNPPWIRVHNLGLAARPDLKRRFSVYRNSAWLGGTKAARVGKGFASQVDASALFIERSIDVLKPGGTMGLIVPAKLWRSLAGGGVRAVTLERSEIRELHDLTDAGSVFDAAVYPSILVSTRRATPGRHSNACSEMSVVAYRSKGENRWRSGQAALQLDSTRGSPWLLIPPEVRAAFDLLVARGVPLTTLVGRPLLGVKTGCNEAFVVVADSRVENLIRVRSGTKEACMERELLRPLLRGESITAWRLDECSESVIWTHDEHDRPLASLPYNAARWLGQWRRELAERSDARGKSRWWTLFRTEAADCSSPRVIWPDIARRPRAAVADSGDEVVPLNSCYVSQCDSAEDALALACVLNSRIASAWLSLIAEPARGGYRRYMGWTMSLLPLPSDWNRARQLLVPLGKRAIEGNEPSESELCSLVLDAYGLSHTDVAPLLDWTSD
jgi:methylase of polypeptide subunit release factors